MKYFKDSQNQIYAYKADGSQDDWIKPGLVPISNEEAASLAMPSKPARTPQHCTVRQGKKALLRTPYSKGGNMLDAVEALISAIPDEFDRRDAEIDFNAPTWERSNPTLQDVWARLGGTEELLDDLFMLAVTL